VESRTNTGLIIGVVGAVLLLGAGVFFWWRNKA
jgi:LPXTG-motif cell wall-anchored protein